MANELKEVLQGGKYMEGKELDTKEELVNNSVEDIAEEPVEETAEVETTETIEEVTEEPVEETIEEVVEEDPSNVAETEAIEEPIAEEPDKTEKYSLNEIPEYMELLGKYSNLTETYNQLVEANNALTEEVDALRAFKYKADKAEKENMINSFYMLSDEDKKDVIDNIDNYSLDDIEAKLSIICVRNKVSFSTTDELNNHNEQSLSYSLDQIDSDDFVPAWVKAVKQTEKEMNI